MKKVPLVIFTFLGIFLLVVQGGWLPTDVRLDTSGAPGAFNSSFPQISSSGSNVYVVWNDSSNGSGVYFNVSKDYGETWLPSDEKICSGAIVGVSDLISDGDNVYVVWKDVASCAGDIYFNYSSNAGASWQLFDTKLDVGDPDNEYGAFDPKLDKNGSNIYAVWTDSRDGPYDIYFNASHDGGASWHLNDTRLDTVSAPGSAYSEKPNICSSGSHVYVVWQDNRNGDYDIYFNRSTNNGATWQSSAVRLDIGDVAGASQSWAPQISCEGNNVYVAWSDDRNGGRDVYFNYSTDNGANWQPFDIRLDSGDAPGASSSTVAQIYCEGSNVYVLFSDCRDGYADIYLDYSPDGGVTWQAEDIRVDAGSPPGEYYCHGPKMSCSDNYFYVTWYESRYLFYDIFANYSTDGGLTWQDSDARLDTGDPPGDSRSDLPEIASYENNVYVVWQDERDGNKDVYFNTATILVPDIKANGSDGPITIAQSDPLTIAVSIEVGTEVGEDADWWLLMRTSDPPPNNWYHYDIPTRSWMSGRSPTRQGGLVDITSRTVPNTSGLSPGTYRFYFGVDTEMNGFIDINQAYYDFVKVTITP